MSTRSLLETLCVVNQLVDSHLNSFRYDPSFSPFFIVFRFTVTNSHL